MTVTELVALADSLYANAESTVNKVSWMNMAMNDLTKYYGLVVIDTSLVTIAGQDEYAFPSGLLDVSQIMTLDMENAAAPANRYDYRRYSKGFSNESSQPEYVYFQTQSSAGAKSLVLYPAPETAGLNIRIKYRKQLTLLSSSTMGASPEFDPAFHDALAFYCAHMICSIGASPNETQANAFMAKYRQITAQIQKASMEEKNRHPMQPKENRQWLR